MTGIFIDLDNFSLSEDQILCKKHNRHIALSKEPEASLNFFVLNEQRVPICLFCQTLKAKSVAIHRINYKAFYSSNLKFPHTTISSGTVVVPGGTYLPAFVNYKNKSEKNKVLKILSYFLSKLSDALGFFSEKLEDLEHKVYSWSHFLSKKNNDD